MTSGLTVGDLEGNTGVVLLEILQADLQVQLSCTSNDVLTSLGGNAKNTRVGLGKTLQSFYELGEIVGVLDLDSSLNDGGDGELHDLHVVCDLGGGQSSRLEQELIDTDETDDVSGRAVLDGVDLSSHHENGSLDGLDEKILLFTGDVVGSLDADLWSGRDGTREDTSESVESTLVGCRYHLGDVQHEWSLGVTVSDGDGAFIVHGSLVERLDTVALSGNRGRKIDDNHLQERVTGRQELLHDGLQESLAFHVLLVRLERKVELGKDRANVVFLEVHNGVEDLVDGVEYHHVEGTLKRLAIGIGTLVGPLLGLWVEVVVSPKSVNELQVQNVKTCTAEEATA